jgi:hypothetical protein
MSRVFFMQWEKESQQLNPLKSMKLDRVPNLGEYFVTKASTETHETFKVLATFDASETHQYGDLIVVVEPIANYFDLSLVKEILSNTV